MKQGATLPYAAGEMVRAAAIASAGGAAEWEQLSPRAQEDALADCATIIRHAFAAMDVDEICTRYYARTGRSLDRPTVLAVLALGLDVGPADDVVACDTLAALAAVPSSLDGHSDAAMAQAFGDFDQVLQAQRTTAGGVEDKSYETACATIRRLRAALEVIATQGPSFGPDGTRQTWRHWAEIARDALTHEAQ
ncbi:hypothetical protein QE400_000074 [Xanthomonas sacchari]|uniref:hypothetical protein n=1 Tax=Xanthomonas sacchari TaxID=56458 RepID=UPI002782236B|nr:hypothetical protein [Xanthomonas sacchari]MDQ1090661.1 hypothetical protein [Xanthomonas sacchari]